MSNPSNPYQWSMQALESIYYGYGKIGTVLGSNIGSGLYGEVQTAKTALDYVGIPTTLWSVGEVTGFNDYLGLHSSPKKVMPGVTKRRGTYFTGKRKKRRTGSSGRKAKARRVGRRRKRSYRKNTLRKNIKKQVKSALMCKENTGVYTRYYTGEVEPFVNAGQDRIVIGMTRNQANASPHNVLDMIFNPFSLRRWLDAASVLYNGKVKGTDAITTVVNNFNLSGFKLETIYASYDLRVWNYTQYPYEIEFFSIENKQNQDTYPLSQMSSDISQDEWVGGYPTFALAGPTQFDIDKSLDLSMIKSQKAKYKIKSLKKGIFYPGASMNIFVKQKGKCIDYTKQLTTGSSLPYYAKNDMQIVFRISPVTHLYASASNHVATNLANATTVTHGFLCEVTEKFKVFEPPETLETRVGDKRAFLNDVPVVPTGIAPFVQKYMATGPTYTDVTNPGT